MGINVVNISSYHDQVHLPLEPFFTLLHNNGFQVKPDDYVEMLKVTERFGSQDFIETAKWICPIVATSESEQVKFYNLVKEYDKLLKAHILPPIKPTVPLWQKILIPVLIVGVLWAFVYLLLKPDPLLVGETGFRQTVKLGDTVTLNSGNLFEGRESDTSRVIVQWNFGRGESIQGHNISHVFDIPGEYIIVREFSSVKIPLSKKRDTSFIYVCLDIPAVEILAPISPIVVDSFISFSANVKADPGTIISYKWTVNDSVITTENPELNRIKFPVEGTYSIECIAFVGDAGSPCSATASQTIKVYDDGFNYQAGFSHFISKQPAVGETRLKWWVHLGLLAPAAMGLFYSLFKRQKKKPVTEVESNREPDRTESKARVKQFYDVPFERTDLRLVNTEKDLRLMLLQLRMKVEEENLVLNVPSTIGSTIRTGGSPQLIYSPQKRHQEYLVLIDGSNPKSMMTHFFEYMVASMSDGGIPFTSFYYDKNFLCTNKQFPLGISLKQLAYLYGYSTLIIMGRAHELVYRTYPLIEEKILTELNRWEHKAIITPLPSCDWDIKEKVLQENMILLPADILSLQKLVPSLKEKVRLHKNQLVNIESKPYTTLYVDFRDVNELRAYLDNDEVLFQWVCATCVYPRLRWEVLVEVGKALLDKYGQPEKLNYTTLLKLSRISWMQEGVFPQSTRLELLKLLTVENEMCARETLQQMLVNVSVLYKGKQHAFEEERKRQQLTNEFVLFGNDQKKFKRFASSEEMFRDIWLKDDILDMPLRKYLEKPAASNYKTPLQVDNVSVGVPDFFKHEDKKERNPIMIRRIASALISVLLVVLWSYLGFWGGAQKVQGMELYRSNIDQDISYQLVVKKDFRQCNDSTGNYIENLAASINIGSIIIPAVYNSGKGVASFNIPYEEFKNGRGQLNLSWGENSSTSQALDFSGNEIPDSMLISCLNYSRPPEPVKPGSIEKDTIWRLIRNGLPASVGEIWKGITANRLVCLDMPNQLLYYSTQGKNTYGLYQIDSVLYNGVSDYKVYTSGAKNQFRIFQMKFLTSSSFEIAICPMVSSRQQLLESQDKDCGNFERMTLYYENNPSRIYFPLTGNNLLRSEKVKLDRKSDTIKQQKNMLDFRMNVYEEIEFKHLAYDRIPVILGKSNIDFKFSRAPLPGISRSPISPSNPFNRAYLTIVTSIQNDVPAAKQDTLIYNQVKQQAVDPVPDCSKTFYSLADVRKSPLTICRLDLSGAGLKEIPKEIYECKNLEQLILGPTTIPEASIQSLQDYLPRCKIIYSLVRQQPQQQQQQQESNALENSAFRQSKVIEFINPGEVEKKDVTYLNGIAKVLSEYPSARVRLVAYYRNDVERKYASANINAIRKYVITGKMSKATDQVIEEYVDESGGKKGTASLIGNFIITTELGAGTEDTQIPTYRVVIFISGFPESFYSPTKK